MFCPKCGSTQDDALKFCKSCGANLFAVRQVVDSRETDEKFDWSKTWVAEMFRSSDETRRRKLEMERKAGITPEVKRITEIKAGVITSSIGVSLAFFLLVLMEGVIRSGKVSTAAVEILARLWIVGVIPLFVGMALIINGVFVSKRLVNIAKQKSQEQFNGTDKKVGPRAIASPNSAEFVPSKLSVTEGTTTHLSRPSVKP